MGIYIEKNPKEWLENHSIKHCIIPIWKSFSKNCLPVVLMETVAAIAYNEKEYDILKQKDKRTKIIYEAPIEDLVKISKLKYKYIS